MCVFVCERVGCLFLWGGFVVYVFVMCVLVCFCVCGVCVECEVGLFAFL